LKYKNSLTVPKFKIEIDNKRIINKPYFISVSGLSEKDNVEIFKHLNTIKSINNIEFNLSCPNIIGKPQVGYDFKYMYR
jgi:dihydroorotate dehydrogenase (fumarate)